jgi:AcrR family transcriptional regulator
LNRSINGGASDLSAALRKDAQRNRDVLIAVARAAFAATSESVPLEAVARGAGVGIGTLYRHFPTRESLVEAVYSAELDELVDCAEPLIHELPADVALRAWLQRYAQFVATKRGMIDALRAGWKSGRIATPATRARITETVGTFLQAGVRQGVLRPDVEPDSLTALMLGVFLSTGSATPNEQVGILLDLLVDAVRLRS